MTKQAAHLVLNAGSSSLKFSVFRQHLQVDDLLATCSARSPASAAPTGLRPRMRKVARLPLIRELIAERLARQGGRIDRAAKRNGESSIAAAGSRVPILVIPTNEEMMIAKHTINVLSQNRRNA